MKDKVSILLIAPSHYWSLRYCFKGIGILRKPKEKLFLEDKGESANYIEGIEVEFIVADTRQKDVRIREFYEPIADKFIEVKENENPYNELLKLATGNYICILSPFQLLQQGWLTELLTTYKTVERAGIGAITSSMEGKSVTPLLDNQLEFITLLTGDNFAVDGTILYSREIHDMIGWFADNMYGLEIKHYAHRATCIGYNNFMLPDVFGIDIIKDNSPPKKGYENFDLSIEKMMETKNWRIEL